MFHFRTFNRSVEDVAKRTLSEWKTQVDTLEMAHGKLNIDVRELKLPAEWVVQRAGTGRWDCPTCRDYCQSEHARHHRGSDGGSS
jgi:hypothetical protein